jgi:peptidoglycan L-alanyl-D-glutamate endopeptidase CwlK
MQELQQGTTGPDVIKMQTALKAAGFSPGIIDGNFGPGTEAALLGFQRSHGLLADGQLDHATAAALGMDPVDLPAPTPFPNITVNIVSKMFPFTHLDSINKNLPAVLSALKAANLTDTPIVLAALATIRAETEGFVPLSEGISRYNTSPGGHPFDLYDNRKDLGNQGPPDGENFKGRGFVQLTGRANYAKFGPLIGLPTLVETPDKANDPMVAAQILAAFVASKRLQIEEALQRGDLAWARRLVNGGSNGLDRFSEAYRTGLNLLQAQPA